MPTFQYHIHYTVHEDYIPFFGELSLDIGDSRGCIAVIILEDQKLEQNETFTVSVAGFSASTDVVILDDGMIVTVHAYSNTE